MDKRDDFIEMAREVVTVAPRDDPDRIIWLHELAHSLRRRYNKQGALTDLEEAIRMEKEAIDTSPDDYVHRGALLDGLGIHLAVRFSKTGSIHDLENAIQLTRQAIGLASGPSDSRGRLSTHLANHLVQRYRRTGSSIDLKEAIEAAQLAVDITSLNDPERASRLNTLANSLLERYGRSGILSELERVIQICREVVEMTQENPEIQAIFKSNLGGHIGDSYLRTDNTHDLDEAIRLSRESVNQLPQGHSESPSHLNTLAVWLSHRYARNRESSDVEEAIKAGEQAIEGTESGGPSLAQYMSNLADCYWNRYTLNGCKGDFDNAVRFYQSALNHSNSRIASRIAAGKHLFETFAHTSHWEEALGASKSAFSLLPQLAPRSLGFADKQRMIARVVDLACDTAAVAFHAGKDILFALNILEKGRGILASAIEQIRMDVLDLQQSHSDLAERFLELQELLDTPIQGVDSASLQALTNRRAEASLELDMLIAEIRKQPGFGNFQNSPSGEELRAAAELGPIVVINTSRFRCDAILIEHDRIRTLPLPNLTMENINEHENQGLLRSSAIFEWFWDVAACPILDALGITGPPYQTTGHTYGGFLLENSASFLSMPLATTISSIQALINGRKRRCQVPAQEKAVLVAMLDTASQSALPFAKEEISVIQELCVSMGLEPCVPEQHRQAVLKDLQDCKIFHFAGHGKTDKDPSHSGLFLEDSILSVADLMDINLRKHGPFLAYLSACGTGRVGGDGFFDESIRLISACQLAGFRHVIGTVWEVSDESCVEVSRIIYEAMRDELFTDKSVCWDLHMALRRLRDKWFSETEKPRCRLEPSREGKLSRDIVACGEEDEKIEALSWVPFVHFGL
ncbi:putative 30S ribosomal protein S17P-like protein [Fusarium austroafricanum]|uniref:Putative 30S ribosomal protein S17P-like protein n=1 Tax=Fusarium austroafricanum TaxID=2364996 RepID=A0A8H4K6Y8_9HYPO|nr:putative 30S ribosomal protein S17P-like protein [Fusarium austroafricanum]